MHAHDCGYLMWQKFFYMYIALIVFIGWDMCVTIVHAIIDV